MSVNLGKSKSKNQAQNTASSSSSQNIDPAQLDFLKSLWGGAQSMGTGAQPMVDQAQAAGSAFAQQQPGQIYNPLLQNFGQTFGGGNPYNEATQQLVNPLVAGLTNIVNSPQQAFGAGGSNPLLDQNVALALEQASTNLQRNVLPGIGRDAQSAGQYGGSRQGIAEGLALSDANRQALQTAMGAYGDQYAGDRAANLQSQAQSDQTRLGAAQTIQQLIAGQAGNTAQGIQAGQQLTNLGMAPSDIYGNLANMQWNPLMNFASILGQPIVLGQSDSTAQGTSFGKDSAFNFGLGKG